LTTDRDGKPLDSAANELFGGMEKYDGNGGYWIAPTGLAYPLGLLTSSGSGSGLKISVVSDTVWIKRYHDNDANDSNYQFVTRSYRLVMFSPVLVDTLGLAMHRVRWTIDEYRINGDTLRFNRSKDWPKFRERAVYIDVNGSASGESYYAPDGLLFFLKSVGCICYSITRSRRDTKADRAVEFNITYSRDTSGDLNTSSGQ
jgi:hypothetical protein